MWRAGVCVCERMFLRNLHGAWEFHVGSQRCCATNRTQSEAPRPIAWHPADPCACAWPHRKNTASWLGRRPSCSATRPWKVSWLGLPSRNCWTSRASRTAASPAGEAPLLLGPAATADAAPGLPLAASGSPAPVADVARGPGVAEPVADPLSGCSGTIEASEGCGVAGVLRRTAAAAPASCWPAAALALALGLRSKGEGGGRGARMVRRTRTALPCPAAAAASSTSSPSSAHHASVPEESGEEPSGAPRPPSPAASADAAAAPAGRSELLPPALLPPGAGRSADVASSPRSSASAAPAPAVLPLTGAGCPALRLAKGALEVKASCTPAGKAGRASVCLDSPLAAAPLGEAGQAQRPSYQP